MNVASLDDDKVSRLHVLRALFGVCEFLPTLLLTLLPRLPNIRREDGDRIVHPLNVLRFVTQLHERAGHAVAENGLTDGECLVLREFAVCV